MISYETVTAANGEGCCHGRNQNPDGSINWNFMTLMPSWNWLLNNWMLTSFIACSSEIAEEQYS